jgi:hypothetical protein
LKKDVPTSVSFGTVTNPAHLESQIALVQVASLCPSKKPSFFIGRSASEFKKFERVFSPNVVCVEVECEDGATISFVDLPGVVSQMMDVSTQSTQSAPMM